VLGSWDWVGELVGGIAKALVLWWIFSLYQKQRRSRRPRPSLFARLNDQQRGWLARGAVGAIPDMGLFCPKCRYNLTGLVDRVCPECGRSFAISEFIEPPRGSSLNQS
jgi:hypothetical protein